ncbi:M55 family metallopeptidase [Orrella sp. NBD-18]|uniref:M55 family metallopeptidase n=1 Tax=Sheuella amnicola TaxID=2707330 RepID=A0A6B2QZP0_9BURK|nr:M55 family metallopeptidase [Sheuella amnicola]NDY83208.1 M55 family metallopeptidase [Sheuella amnicola]HBI84568.1 aminopeptidase [Alcaligenaceae bacterium]
MKILISADIEGVAGVFNVEQTRPGNSEYERARRWMTEETNAAIRGAFKGGAQSVLVNDSHGSFRNLLADQLDARAQFVMGKPRYLGMMSGLELGCEAVVLLGYHSRAQGRGILAHTINSFAFARVEVNDQVMGEAGLYGSLATEMGVPVLLGSGDDQFISENTQHFPSAVWVQTKTAYGHSSGVTRSMVDVQQELEEKTALAVRTHIEAANQSGQTLETQLRMQAPIRCRLTTQGPSIADLFCTLPTLTRIDGVTIGFTSATMHDLIRTLNSLAAMSFMLR